MSDKPSIDWSHVSDLYDWMCTDEHGDTNIFALKPSQCYITDSKGVKQGFWDDYAPMYIDAKGFASFKPGTCDWKDSLVERPRNEG